MDCNVCFTSFAEKEHQPRSMPCGHSLCTVCIKGNIKNGQLVCPFCREIHVAAAVTVFPVNFAMIELLREATNYETVVEKTKGIALKSTPTKLSNLILEPELHAGICAEHGSYRLFWCKKCDLWLCRDCTVVEHPLGKCIVSSIREKLDHIKEEETSLLTQAIENRSIHINTLKEYQGQLKSRYEKQDAHMHSLTDMIQHIKSVMVLLKKEQGRVETILSDGEDVIERLKLANKNLIKKDSVQDITLARNLSQQCYKEVSDWVKTSGDDLNVAEIHTISEDLSKRVDLMMKMNGSENMHTSNIAAISSFVNSLQKTLRHLSEKEKEEIIEDIIKLLQKVDIKDPEIWKSLLRIFRYNETAARLIGQIPLVMKENITITDSNVTLYAALFKYNTPKQVTVNISDNPIERQNISELFLTIRDICCKVDHIRLNHLYYYPEDITGNEDIILITEDIIERCHVSSFRGPVMPNLQTIPESMRELYVSVPDIITIHRLQNQLANRIKPFEALYIRLSLAIEERHLKDIQPLAGCHKHLSLQIPDVKTLRDGLHGAELLNSLLPLKGNKSFFQLHFPRCQLKEVKNMEGLLQSLNGIKVTNRITFPESSKPSSEAEQLMVQCLAKSITGCQFGIYWSTEYDWIF